MKYSVSISNQVVFLMENMDTVSESRAELLSDHSGPPSTPCLSKMCFSSSDVIFQLFSYHHSEVRLFFPLVLIHMTSLIWSSVFKQVFLMKLPALVLESYKKMKIFLFWVDNLPITHCYFNQSSLKWFLISGSCNINLDCFCCLEPQKLWLISYRLIFLYKSVSIHFFSSHSSVCRASAVSTHPTVSVHYLQPDKQTLLHFLCPTSCEGKTLLQWYKR